ncbi:VOC family protein [Pseudorhizobium pelagicum]|uniref:Glyoxalase n=1 Tax=Pseudorhizobium pelagicum TaxID=1509405 RepID=A0A922NZ76_9HYPH|nr:VOC family protein [Pseudorhizobium pelagicum]KEQ04810.1 glyoxalase [Pseudorhizobium pelagicum]KEQ07409.1 glyoxalase [Pseudorhizobium pelagicum]
MAIPFAPVGIDHVVLLIDDMSRALTFYIEILGCRPGYSYPALGMEQVWCGSSLIVLWDVTDPGGRKAAPSVVGGRNVDHICIATTPFDHEALRTHLEDHGITIIQEAYHGGARGMGHSFYIHYPFGNKIEIKGPADYRDGRSRD